jgi:hypothetical protein
VFIDELDRCEPEHILDLLASIKLFFAYGENIIYFVAVDKEAVSKAIKTKYGDVIKAEEYLEKIFNISFNMPKDYSLKNFIKQYEFFNDDKIAEKLERFFKAIKFTNPRHLKKVLNKYELLIMIKKGLDKNNLIPKIIRVVEENGAKKRVGYLFDTVFVLYFIILYEFYYEKYLEVKRYKYRVEHLKYTYTTSKIFQNSYITKASKSYFEDFSYKIKNSDNNLYNLFKEFSEDIGEKLSNKDNFIKNVFLFEDMMTILQNVNDKDKKNFNEFIGYISIFLSCVGDENIDRDETNLTERFAKAGITVDFWEYIKNNYEDLIEKSYSNPYPFTNLFKMVETYL